jgi:hypothetical protein
VVISWRSFLRRDRDRYLSSYVFSFLRWRCGSGSPRLARVGHISHLHQTWAMTRSSSRRLAKGAATAFPLIGIASCGEGGDVSGSTALPDIAENRTAEEAMLHFVCLLSICSGQTLSLSPSSCSFLACLYKWCFYALDRNSCLRSFHFFMQSFQ